MALKKEGQSVDNFEEELQQDDVSLLELRNLENKIEIESQPIEVLK